MLISWSRIVTRKSYSYRWRVVAGSGRLGGHERYIKFWVTSTRGDAPEYPLSVFEGGDMDKCPLLLSDDGVDALEELVGGM